MLREAPPSGRLQTRLSSASRHSTFPRMVNADGVVYHHVTTVHLHQIPLNHINHNLETHVCTHVQPNVQFNCKSFFHFSPNASPQVYFYCFDVFRAAGIEEHQLRYAALGTGLCETLTSVACVSAFLNSFITSELTYRGENVTFGHVRAALR